MLKKGTTEIGAHRGLGGGVLVAGFGLERGNPRGEVSWRRSETSAMVRGALKRWRGLGEGRSGGGVMVQVQGTPRVAL